MDVADFVATGISLASLCVAVVVMMRTARRNEIDKILAIVTELQRDAAQKTAVDAVQDIRINRIEQDIGKLGA
jgi:hypothetical protein